MLKVFIGHDWREQVAWDVCAYSLRKHSSIPLEIYPISSSHPWYNRTFRWKSNQRIDALDEKPFSTDFSFARFLVPLLARDNGWVLFCDCDFLFRRDVAELIALGDEAKSVMCVQHRHIPSSEKKMDGMEQTVYTKKNWSSLTLWNTNNRRLYLPDTQLKGITYEKVNTYPGTFLHNFAWLEDRDIGALPEEWNHLVGYSKTESPAALHFTEGGPWMKGYEKVEYADEWTATLEEMQAMGK